MNKKKIIIFISIILLIIALIILFISLSKDNKSYAIGDTLTDIVIVQSKGNAWNSGASGVYYTNNHEYRYIGANVNNYVSFNNDLYRIIGVFDENSHGVEGEYLVKLIRSRILGSYSWGAYNTSDISGMYSNSSNDWTGNTTGVKSNLNILLNEYFYKKTNTSSAYGICSAWTYYGNNTGYRTNNCSDIVGYGISSEYRDYIENVTWYLYGYSSNYLSKQNFYLCERGQYSGCTSANSGVYATSTKAKIGLMYPSDYMYASGYFGHSDVTSGSLNYFGNQNWLLVGTEWTIMPNSYNTDVLNFNISGGMRNNSSAYGFGIRPTFYLKSSVYVTGGTGTFDDPYTISCDDCN